MHCSQCALVSSSGQMLGAGVGEEIDNVGCVIRMNNAPTQGYEKDVGNRTSVRVVSHTSVPLLVKNERYYFQKSADTTYVFWGPERNMRQDGKGHIFNTLLKIAEKYPKVRIYAVTSEQIQYCDGVFQNETGKNRYSRSFKVPGQQMKAINDALCICFPCVLLKTSKSPALKMLLI